MSLSSRIDFIDNDKKLLVRPDPQNPNRKLRCRSVNLKKSIYEEIPFQEIAYGSPVTLVKGVVLELKEDDGESELRSFVYQPRFTLRVHAEKGRTAISFSSNDGIHLSRVMLEDPQKRLYFLGASGTLDEKNVWYLPGDVSFSKDGDGSNWHIKLDKYSSCVYEYNIDRNN